MNYKKITVILLFIHCIFTAFAFDWPQTEILSDSFYSYFGQLRGGTISSSLIFQESSDIKSSDDGNIIAVISEHDGDQGWYNSPLGNAVIIAHKDNLLTVYGNLDGETLAPNLEQMRKVQTGTRLGTSGNSGWHQGNSCLEFQVIDTKQKTAINPRILMPRIGKELEIIIGNISAVSKKGIVYDFLNQQTLPAGQYLLYRQRQKISIPYRTSVSINGAVVETINFDLLRQDNNRLCVAGRKTYPVELVYPDDKKQLLADVTLSRGRNVLTIIATDILGASKTVTYTLNIQ